MRFPGAESGAAGAGAGAPRRYVMFAVGGVMSPELDALVQGQADDVAAALAPWDAGARYASFEERATDARLLYDEDTFRLLRALRSHWDPSGLFVANHEIKE